MKTQTVRNMPSGERLQKKPNRQTETTEPAEETTSIPNEDVPTTQPQPPEMNGEMPNFNGQMPPMNGEMPNFNSGFAESFHKHTVFSQAL